LRAQSGGIAAKLAPTDPLRAELTQFAQHADVLRKRVVATTEGGAITGEQRLREDAADVYGAIMSTEAAPTPYAVARVAVLDRELADVERSFATLTSGEMRSLNEKLKAKSLPQLAVVSTLSDTGTPIDSGAGAARTIFSGLVGSRYVGSVSALNAKANEDR
jgi:hypothetical protein